jgi:hypothetical protein
MAISRGKESYENLKILWDVLNPELKQVKKMRFLLGTHCYKLEFFFCSDAKFLLIALGMTAASGKYSCPYCCIPNVSWGECYDSEKTPKIYAEDYARSGLDDLKDVKKFCQEGECGCKIPYQFVGS